MLRSLTSTTPLGALHGSITRLQSSLARNVKYHPALLQLTARISTTSLKEDDFKTLKVDQQRLMSDIHHTCQWGTGKRWGRHAFSFCFVQVTLSWA